MFSFSGTGTFEIELSDDKLSTRIAPQGRLSLMQGIAVPVSDIVGATALYYVPALGTRVPVWDGSNVQSRDIGSGLSLVLSTTAQPFFGPYDVFAFMDGDVLMMGSGPNWTVGAGGQFARGTGAGSTDIELKEGVWTNRNAINIQCGPAIGDVKYVPANQATYLGSFVCLIPGQIDSTRASRQLFNAYNRVETSLRVNGNGGSWTYSTAAWRQANGDSNNTTRVMMGLPTSIKLQNRCDFISSAATFRQALIGIGMDSSTSPYPGTQQIFGCANNNGAAAPLVAELNDTVGQGWHSFRMLEYGAGADTQTFRSYSSYGLIGSAFL